MSKVSYKEILKGMKVDEVKGKNGVPFFVITDGEGYTCGASKFKDRAEKICKKIASHIAYKKSINMVKKVK